MEIKVKAGDIIDKLDKEEIRDLFAAYLEKNAQDLFMESNGYWSRKLTPFGKEVADMLREEIKKELIADLIADADFIKIMKEIKEEVKQDMGEAIQKGVINYIVNRMFVEKEDLVGLIYRIIREDKINAIPN